MFRICTKAHLFKANNTAANKIFSDPHNVFSRQFGSESPKHSEFSDNKGHGSKHRDAFRNLRNKIDIKESQENLNNYAYGNSFESMKQKLYEDFKHSQEKLQNKINFNNFLHPGIKAPYQDLKSHAKHEEDINTAAKETKAHIKSESNTKVEQRADIRDKYKLKLKNKLDKISERAPLLVKVASYIGDCLNETFPHDNFCKKIQAVKQAAKEAAQKERERIANMTEEELAKFQQGIPEWRRTALTILTQDVQEDRNLRRRLINSIANKMVETHTMKQVYKSEAYKEYQAFRQEMTQFKEDLKDHLNHSQNPVVVASLTAYSRISLEGNTARAIHEMRKRLPRFSIYELERDARGVFCQIYDAFLCGDMDFIEHSCGEAALVYFRTLMKKREVDNVYPKYDCVWDSEHANLIGGRITMENSQPRFAFSIYIQEVCCNISKKTGKVVEGAEDKVTQTRYTFILALHDNPDLELTGHPWEMVEIRPGEAFALLA